MALTIPLSMVLAATIYNRTRSRFAGFYETAVFIPHVVSLVPAAMAWKGVFDAISNGYENIEVMLICSNTFTSGVIFESFKSGDWASTEGFTTTMSFKTFQPN